MFKNFKILKLHIHVIPESLVDLETMIWISFLSLNIEHMI